MYREGTPFSARGWALAYGRERRTSVACGSKCMFIIMGNYMYYWFTRLRKERRIFRSREWIRNASFKDRAQVGS